MKEKNQKSRYELKNYGDIENYFTKDRQIESIEINQNSENELISTVYNLEKTSSDYLYQEKNISENKIFQDCNIMLKTPSFSSFFIDQIKKIEESNRKISDQRKKQNNIRIFPEKTAISRKSVSTPLKIAFKKDLFVTDLIGLDYGSGKSLDAEFLLQHNVKCYQYDPFYAPICRNFQSLSTGKSNKPFLRPECQINGFDFILLIFILNVLPIEECKNIAIVIESSLKKSGFVVVGLREDKDAIRAKWRPYSDGYITTINTFQRFFKNHEGYLEFLQNLFPNFTIKRIGKETWILNKN